jgi:hypothetical protein
MQLVAAFLESQGIPYRVVGSLASMAYGEPRFTTGDWKSSAAGG